MQRASMSAAAHAQLAHTAALAARVAPARPPIPHDAFQARIKNGSTAEQLLVTYEYHCMVILKSIYICIYALL